MANLVSIGTGNFTAAGTWGLVDAASYANSETTGATTPTTSGVSSRSAAFTPAASTITAVAVKLRNRTGTTGTMTVALILSSDNSVQKTVTINMADLQAALAASLDGGWIVFQFSSGLAVNGSTAYKVDAITSSANQVGLFVGSGNDWSRMLITSTTQAPVAGDDVVVAGNYTGAGTSNSITVTMDETAATDYGSAPTAANGLVNPGIAVAAKGTLTFKDTSAANPYLRMSNSIIVYNGGTLNDGTTGTPIPRDSTSILEFDCAADGDYGLLLRNGSVGNIQGLSRTSGKDITRCKLNADFSGGLITTGAAGTVGFGSTSGGTTTTFAGLEGTGISRLAGGFTDTAANSNHSLLTSALGSVTNTTQVYTVWIAAGSGTNKRYVRQQFGNTGTVALTNGFYADIDLQLGTIGACTAVGNGTATSSAIVAYGGGFICTIIGKASSGALSPIASLFACNAAGTIVYTGDATQNFLCYGPQVYTAAALPSPTLTVDTDTGWLAGDVYAVASTDRTNTNCEPGVLDSNAGATTLPAKQNLLVAHSGTSPTQAEIILLTRNVKIRSTSSTLMAYVFCDQTATVDIDWAELYYIGGISATNKRGLEVITTTGSFSMQFSSIHDTEINGLYCATSSAFSNFTFSNNTMWNMATVTGPACQIPLAVTSTTWVIDSNILLRTSNGNGWTLADVGGTFTNNTVAGAASVGINPTESAATAGTFSGNVTHSNGGNGYQVAGASGNGTHGTVTSWRNTGAGISVASTCTDLLFTSPNCFGNTTRNYHLNAACSVRFTDPISNGDTTFATTNSFDIGVSPINLLVDNADMSSVSGIKTACTNDVNMSQIAFTDIRAIFRNSKWGAATEVANVGNMAAGGYISSQKHDQTAGLHKTWTKYGTTTNTGALSLDSVIFNTAAPSQKCIPNTSVAKLESAPLEKGIKIAVANGATVDVSVYVRKSVVGDTGGVAYVGNQPRLILRANPAIGVAADTVIDTMTVANNSGTWEKLNGTTGAATDDSAMEFVVDCDGTSGAWINVDDWANAL